MGVVLFDKNKYVCEELEFCGDVMLVNGWCIPLYYKGMNYELDMSSMSSNAVEFKELEHRQYDSAIKPETIKIEGVFKNIKVDTAGVLMKYSIKGVNSEYRNSKRYCKQR
jgi:hypothetical protein